MIPGSQKSNFGYVPFPVTNFLIQKINYFCYRYRGGRPNRRSMMPELMNRKPEVRKPEPEEEEFEDAEENVDDLGLGPNPTPQMIAMKRKSLSVARKPSPMKKLNVTLPVPAAAPKGKQTF